jgi:hypothetical protein
MENKKYEEFKKRFVVYIKERYSKELHLDTSEIIVMDDHPNFMSKQTTKDVLKMARIIIEGFRSDFNIENK